MTNAITTTHLPYQKHSGKVRDVYDLGEELLFVATDRISAFDAVLPDGIPGKGIVLNELSEFWFEKLGHIIPNHFVAMGKNEEAFAKYRGTVDGDVARRSMIVKKAEPIPVECVVRGYLAGSAWAEYRTHGTIGGENAPYGLLESALLERPLFTPTTKAQVGHDEAISIDEMASLVGDDLTKDLERISVQVYSSAREYAAGRGIIIADTKFEFGIVDGAITLIDEVLTPDSSRFWSADRYATGRGQDSLDKQFVRDWLESAGWNKEPPPPNLPKDVVDQTASRYRDVYARLTGQNLVP